jgi:Uncharacterised nucleotidyltransferase
VARGRQIGRVLRGAWRARPDAAGLEAADLLEASPLLLRRGSAGLAWWRARSSGVPTPALQPLHDAFALHALHASVIEAKIPAAFGRLRARGVEPLLGKGWAVARLYPAPGLRPYGDIDVYVRPRDEPAARSALGEAGGEALPVDLHGGLAELDDLPFGDVFARSRMVRLGGSDVRVFGVEDHLRLLALHLLRHGAWRPAWLCDLALLVENRPRDFDWDVFLAGDAVRTDAAACALRLAEELLGADLAGAPARIRRRALPRWLAPAVLRQWSDARFEPHGTRAPMAVELRRPWALPRALRARWPNPVEATLRRRGPFNDLPRLPFQVAECLCRTLRFVRAPRGFATAPER